MRLIRFGPLGNEKPGVMDDAETRRDLSAHFKDWDLAFFGSADIQRLAEILKRDAAVLASGTPDRALGCSHRSAQQSHLHRTELF